MKFCAPIAFLLVFSSAAAIPLASSQQTVQKSPAPNVISVDASVIPAPPETGYLHLGGASSNGHSLQVNSRYLVLDGRPWFPLMGELHYTRLPESMWEDEILKMKAGGINIISTYVFWIHHEEIEGQFDWTGRRNLRHFVELCAKHGMYVYLRPGPWAHGEVRNGGFPDWLARLPNTRTNDPTYLVHVQRFFNQIGAQVYGLMFKDGGPIIGTQLENEYGLHGPGRGAEHILKLKQLALAAGIDPPLFSVTGWPSLDFPPQEVIPVSGGYPDGFWYGSQTNLPPSMNYLFNFNRELGDMGATVPSEDPTGKVNLAHDPYFAAEQAGGMAAAYHRRPLLSADDIASLTLTGVGSGINLYGYYMFHGGTNPQGALSTLQESQATGYPNDLPEIDYDFEAPLGAAGQERDSFRKTRLMHLFLNAYGSELAPMAAFAPAHHSRNAADISQARIAVRANGDGGFLFVNNYVRQLPMPVRPGFQVHIQLASGEVVVPSRPIDVPANTYFMWPFHLPVGHATLRYSTAQLLTRLDTPAGKLVVFFAIPGVPPEFVFEAHTVRSLSARKDDVSRTNDTITLSNLRPGLDSAFDLTDSTGATSTVLLLTQQQAEQTTLLRLGAGDHLALSASALLLDGTYLHLRSTDSPVQQIALLPDLHLSPHPSQPSKKRGLWSTYTFSQPAKSLNLAVTQTQTAVPRKKMDMGPYVDWRKTAVPTTPPDSSFAHAATWQLQWRNPDMSGLSQVFLQLNYSGDIARLYSSSTLLDDNFFNGLPWQVGLKSLGPAVQAAPFTLKLLPMPAIAPIYLDARARNLLDTAPKNPGLIRAELIPEYEAVVAILP